MSKSGVCRSIIRILRAAQAPNAGGAPSDARNELSRQPHKEALRTAKYAVTVEGKRLVFWDHPDLYGYHLIKNDGEWFVYGPAYTPEEQAMFREKKHRRYWGREADLEVIVRPFEPQSHIKKE